MKFEIDLDKDRVVAWGFTATLKKIAEQMEAHSKLSILFLKMNMVEIEAVN